MTRKFEDREQAGRELALRLRHLAPGSLVLGLARGGVPVAAEVARERGWQLDVLVVRKLGVPGNPELAMGALCEGDVRVLNDEIVTQHGVSLQEISHAVDRARTEMHDRSRQLRQGRAAPDPEGRHVVLVDDGLATGATMKAACKWARMNGASSVVVAVPVAPMGWEDAFAQLADECIAVSTPAEFLAVGLWYRDFKEVTDGDVVRVLTAATAEPVSTSYVVRVSEETPLSADVAVPPAPRGCVVFVHGSGSSRLSPRNRHVAGYLNKAGFVTVLFDLLTEDEARDRDNVFDINLLANRLVAMLGWVQTQEWSKGLQTGLFGASTGAAAALVAAAHRPKLVSCVVSRGGRPDLAGNSLADVECPVLLVVGSLDHAVLHLNRSAATRINAPHVLSEVKGATHLFEEPGTLDSAAHLVRDFFLRHLHTVPAVSV